MKTRYLSILLLTMSLISFSSFAQTANNQPLLGLPGDDLDLYAVLNLFQKSKTIEDFEKSMNDQKAGIVNIDLNNDGKVDFIKVVSKKDGDNFLFILQDPISKTETQDVAVISVSKDAAGKVSMQIIGDKELYGKDYVVEPRTEPTKSVTANPAYTGDDPVTVNVQATTQVVVVESAPIVKYVYSPVYAPYYPAYYYGYYPPYWRAVAVVGIGIYRHNNYHHHHNYHGGHGGHGSVNVNRNVTHNNYNRNSSRTVNNNIKNGNFKTSGQGGSRTTTSQTRRASSGASTSNRSLSGPSSSSRSTSRSTSPGSYKSSGSRSTSSRSYGGRSYSGGRSGGGGRSRGGGRRR